MADRDTEIEREFLLTLRAAVGVELSHAALLTMIDQHIAEAKGRALARWQRVFAGDTINGEVVRQTPVLPPA